MHDWRDEVRRRLAGASLDPAAEADIAEEIAQHLGDKFDDLRANGANEDDACAALLAHLDDLQFRTNMLRRRRAQRASVPPPIGAERIGAGIIASLWQDVRYGWRGMWKSPAFTIVAVLSLALGIGANTAIFSVLYAVLFQRMALPHAEQLVALRRSSANGLNDQFAYAEYDALRRAPGVPRLEGFAVAGVSLGVGSDRGRFRVELVTGGFHSLLGVRPILGRVITTDDEQTHAPVIVLSQDLWERFFASDPAAIGRIVIVHDAPFTLVGVLPRSYHGLYFGAAFDAALPVTVSPQLGAPDVRLTERPLLLNLIARLEPGWSSQRATLAFDQTFQACCADQPLPGAPPVGKGAKAGARQHVMTSDASRGLSHPKMDLRGEFRGVLFALMGGVVIILLVACANVANLLLARGSARRREFAVRLSMGAIRSRVVRQLITEAVELATLGGVFGVMLAWLGLRVLAHDLPAMGISLADVVTLRPSPAILGFTLAATVACTLVFGVFPAFGATRADVVLALKDGSRGTGRSRGIAVDRSIVVAQVALAVVLVCTATLFVATLHNLERFDGGYRSTRVLLGTIETRGTPYEPQGITPFYKEILNRMRRVPGVQSAAMSSSLPLIGGRSMTNHIRLSGYEPGPGEDMSVLLTAVTPDYFRATGIGLQAGREFDEHDDASGARVAIVSAAFARHYLAKRDPIGSVITVGDGAAAAPLRVVGVARDAHYDDLRLPPTELFYEPVAQSGNWPYFVFAARTAGDPNAVASAIRLAARTAAPAIDVSGVAGVEDLLNGVLTRERLAAELATLFGCLALGLAAVGLYGVVSYSVSRRTQEIGVRMALGARPNDVLWLVVRQTLAMTVIGVGVGAPLALGAAHAIRAQLYGIGATDARALAGAAAVLIAVGIGASMVPGRRAARVDPVQALRSD